jgi:nitrogen regulatory protein PII
MPLSDHGTTLHLVTIIAEPVLEERITRELAQFGARGFSVTEGRGAGSRGIRASDFGGAHVRIETVVSKPSAKAIMEHVASHYFAHYAVIAWVGEVQVVRGEKYV